MIVDATLSNWLLGAASLFLAALITAIFTRSAKRGDARAAQEAALVGLGPQLVREQNVRIDTLGKDIDRQRTEIDRLWEENRTARRREQECQEDLHDAQRRIATLEQRMNESC